MKLRRLVIALTLLVPRIASAQLDVDVWVGRLDLSSNGVAISDLKNISQRAGYDNQPAFFPDETKLAYTTDDSAGTHSVLYDLTNGQATPLPDAKGYSPTPTANGDQFMTLNDGAVWLHDLNGKTIGQLTKTKDAGYYSRFDDRTWALFINDKERRIVIYDASKDAQETVARGGVTPLYRVPGERAVTFVEESPFSADPAEAAKIAPETVHLLLRKLDMKRRKVETLATIPFPTGGHHVWTPRGTILMASGATLYEWNPKTPRDWKKVVTFTDPDLQGITRIAISPKNDRIAIVSTPRDETLIRDARNRMNDAIAAHQVDAIMEPFAEKVTIIRGNGDVLSGSDAVKKAFTEMFAKDPSIVYVRKTQRVEISTAEPLAAEQGEWTATPSKGGTYLAVWRKTITDSGLPFWQIVSETYVTLR